MTKYFSNNFALTNLYKRPSLKSEIVTQMIFGDSFFVSKKTKKWLKIKLRMIITKDIYKIKIFLILLNQLIKLVS